MRPIKLLAPTLLAAAIAFPAASNAALITHSSALWSQHAHFSKVRAGKRATVPQTTGAGCTSSASASPVASTGKRGAASFRPKFSGKAARGNPKPATPLPCAGATPPTGSGTGAPPVDVAELLPEVFGPEPFNETGTPPPPAPRLKRNPHHRAIRPDRRNRRCSARYLIRPACPGSMIRDWCRNASPDSNRPARREHHCHR